MFPRRNLSWWWITFLCGRPPTTHPHLDLSLVLGLTEAFFPQLFSLLQNQPASCFCNSMRVQLYASGSPSVVLPLNQLVQCFKLIMVFNGLNDNGIEVSETSLVSWDMASLCSLRSPWMQNPLASSSGTLELHIRAHRIVSLWDIEVD